MGSEEKHLGRDGRVFISLIEQGSSNFQSFWWNSESFSYLFIKKSKKTFSFENVSVRVVPESLILLLFDQIVPMLASPHWRLLFSSCNTSITTTTTALLRICFVPICFLA